MLSSKKLSAFLHSHTCQRQIIHHDKVWWAVHSARHAAQLLTLRLPPEVSFFLWASNCLLYSVTLNL